MKDIREMISDVENELYRVKLFVNSNGYHNGTVINQIIREYRQNLKQYLTILKEDSQDGVTNYEID